MTLKVKAPWIRLGLIAALSLSGAAYATNALEPIVTDPTHKSQHHSNERNSDSEQYGKRHNKTSLSCHDERNLRSVQGNVHTSMKFINHSNQEVRSYWLDYNGRRVFYKAIPPNGNYTQPTFQTHPWVITDQRDNCINIYISNQPSAIAEIH